MKIYGNENLVVAKRKCITCYRRNRFYLEIVAKDIIGEDYAFANCSALIHVKTTTYKAEGKTPLLVFTSSGDNPEITFVEASDGVDSKIVVEKNDLTIPAGKYVYDVFLVEANGHIVAWQNGDFNVVQNVTEYTAPVPVEELAVSAIWVTDNDVSGGWPSYDGIISSSDYMDINSDIYDQNGNGNCATSFLTAWDKDNPTPIDVGLSISESQALYTLYGTPLARYMPITAVVVNKPAPMYCLLKHNLMYGAEPDPEVINVPIPYALFAGPTQGRELFYEIKMNIPAKTILEVDPEASYVATGKYVNLVDFDALLLQEATAFFEHKFTDYGIEDFNNEAIGEQYIYAFQFILDIYMHNDATTPAEVAALIDDANIIHHQLTYNFDFEGGSVGALAT
jgi:hypothetical protein